MHAYQCSQETSSRTLFIHTVHAQPLGDRSFWNSQLGMQSRSNTDQRHDDHLQHSNGDSVLSNHADVDHYSCHVNNYTDQHCDLDYHDLSRIFGPLWNHLLPPSQPRDQRQRHVLSLRSGIASQRQLQELDSARDVRGHIIGPALQCVTQRILLPLLWSLVLQLHRKPRQYRLHCWRSGRRRLPTCLPQGLQLLRLHHRE